MNPLPKGGCILLAICALAACASRQAGAPVIDRAPARSPSQATPAVAAQPPQAPFLPSVPEGFHQVKRGETLYSIALEHGVDYRSVAQWNDLDDPTKLRVGQLLRIKPAEERAAVQAAPARGSGRIEARALDSLPASPQGDGGKLAKSDPAPAPTPEPAPAEPQAIQFMWPVKGKLLAGFSEPRSKGIDIEGKLGDPVLAAASGRVTYIGSGIPGLGKLVVIKHDNGFITVYAHNREILVKEQQSVARGQKIAELGSSDAERPKLHFQIRKGSVPVDPLRYLPGS